MLRQFRFEKCVICVASKEENLFLGDDLVSSQSKGSGGVGAVGEGSVSEGWGTESVSCVKWSGSGQWGSSDGGGGLQGDWGSLNQSCWGSCVLDGSWSVSGGGVVGDTGVGVSAGLEQGLLVSGVGGDWADDGLLSEDWLLLEDGLGNVLGGHDCWRLDSLVSGWGVDVGGLSHGDGPGGQLRGHLGVGVGLGGGVGEVAAQPVALDGGGVMGWSTDQGGGWHHWSWDGWDDGTGSGGQGRGKDSNEGLHFVCKKVPFG